MLRLYIMLLAFTIAIVALFAVGCGDGGPVVVAAGHAALIGVGDAALVMLVLLLLPWLLVVPVLRLFRLRLH